MITEEELEQSMISGLESLVEQKAPEVEDCAVETSDTLMLGALLEEYHHG